VGVMAVPTKPFGDSKPKFYRARTLVIVSGTISSPIILQRSGIGDLAKLCKVGVKPLVDLPGVSLNFQDH
jgi:alcohol oxidase